VNGHRQQRGGERPEADEGAGQHGENGGAEEIAARLDHPHVPHAGGALELQA